VYQDTITAIATPQGSAGIGIVRLSGEQSRTIAERIFRGRLLPKHLSYGHIIDPENGDAVDEVLLAYMPAPHTYTREDVVEINCHGGPLPLQRVLELTLRYGARLAQPGEFTLRAFLNGRIDLAQAESVLAIIHSKTQASLRLATRGLGGHLSAEIKALRNQIMPVLAFLTARIDFPEDEIEEQETLQPLSQAKGRLQKLIARADAGIIYRQGVRTAIVGRPNVGKSSLLNRLLGQERAIVTPIPGTTRDTIEEVINIRGIPLVLIDTAGIIHSQDTVEAIGVERSRQAIEQADLILWVIDLSQPLNELDEEIGQLIGEKTALIAANKCDLPPKAQVENLPREVIFTSALTGEGLDKLEQKLVDTLLGGKVSSSDELLVSNPRHKQALVEAEKHLSQALSALEAELPDDFITIDLTTALNALGEITGETVQDELLETIFSQFCIGK
jgi:tRNA modification GTPase